ncbi:amidohydrolase [Rhizobacter sp. J219]|uniref:amidohydrolase n=1 Tax=Rhizobacter sp. J219 TaxID=2898430 RepID=UPI0021512ACB|nr:amidohydrolase [Rhizobacter sp. J219]MCR5884247.1 amidohydrolase [Rhizobacter sp. J219]
MKLLLLRTLLCATLLAGSAAAPAQALDSAVLAPRVAALQAQMVAWRRDIHQHPELSGQEARTARLVAEHLRNLGLTVKTGIAGHGVVGILKGGRPGKVVALRADMDALPVLEATGLPFASRVKARLRGQDTPVMHACGHDGHTAILMGVAEALAGIRQQIPGTVKFIFQPAEEGLPEDDHSAWGARAMVAQGVLDNPKVDAVFGLHLSPNLAAGTLGVRSGPMMAGADTLRIDVTGEQTHGAAPWTGTDPIVVAAQIITGLQTVVSRQLNINHEPVVLTIAAIHGGNRENIIPDKVEMLGTLRTFDEEMRTEAKQRITTTAEKIAEASGAKARVTFGPASYSVTVNHAALTDTMTPTLQRASGGKVVPIPKISASEDFSEYQKVVPGLFYILGAPPKGKTPMDAATNHSPNFDFDEDAMQLGALTLGLLALDYLALSR